MATKKAIEIVRPQFEYVCFNIVGDTPLILHAWDEKSKRMMLEKQMKTARANKHDVKVPTNDFINSMYWLTPKPEDGENDEQAMKNFREAIENGARFGFPISGIKQSIIMGAKRAGLDVVGTEVKGAMFIEGNTPDSTFDIAEVLGTASDHVEPIMREDMVRVGGISKTADIRYRAMIKDWRIPLRMKYNKNGKYSLEQLLTMVDYGGFVVGLGEWRPERDGQNGMYHLEIESN